MTTAQVVETSVTVNNNSPIQDYVQPDDQTQPFEMTSGFKPFTYLGWGKMFLAVLRPSTIQHKSITEINCDIRWIVNYLGDSAIQRLNNRGQADSDKPSSFWEEVKIQHSDYKVSLLLFCRYKENKRKNKVENKKTTLRYLKLSTARVANETVSVFEELPCWSCATARDAPAADVPGVEDIAQILSSILSFISCSFLLRRFILQAKNNADTGCRTTPEKLPKRRQCSLYSRRTVFRAL